MPDRKLQTNVYLEPEQFAALKELSERTRVPVAVYIRRGVDMVLESFERDRERRERAG